jgi:inward rectifier potassium channel
LGVSVSQLLLKFSHNAIIAPYGNGTALMIRLSPYKNTNFTDAEAQMTLGMSIMENGVKANKFYQLDLELSQISALTLRTLVHPLQRIVSRCTN